jgi:hypothetical protein
MFPMLVSGPRLIRALRGEPRGKQERTYCGAPGNREALLEGLGTRLRDMNYYRGNPHYLQRSLQEPVNIDTPDAAECTSSLPHSGCTVVKVNGDYIDIV